MLGTRPVFSPCSVPEFAELVRCVLNAYCTNLFVFDKNYLNFD
jgi:hypothetical protein